jgi:acyl-CoA reductase-like NAD-dependent aldehyde dehydrogenase
VVPDAGHTASRPANKPAPDIDMTAFTGYQVSQLFSRVLKPGNLKRVVLMRQRKNPQVVMGDAGDLQVQWPAMCSARLEHKIARRFAADRSSLSIRTLLRK